ncbi:unnamed protein product [Heligmosomoides polygyrus]|uniref:Gag-like protein n=1 Tax=Heligmosomoides polygyrus TaxID=6339 RepID=A0A183FE18_HELPZ|nr:unnamed protein product [Heligmosomoides polygyrus]
MSFKGGAKLTVQVDKGPRHRIGLFVMAGDDDMIVLGTSALKKLGWSLAPNAQSSRGRAEVSRGRRHQRQQAEVKEAAVQQRRTKASEVVTVARRICLKPGETKVVSPHRDEMKQGEVVRSSGEILPDTKGQGAQHQTQVAVTNSFAGAKMFREGEVVSTYEGTEKSKEEAPAATTIPQPRVAHMQRKRVIKKEPVGRSTLATKNAQLSVSKIDGNEVDYLKTAMGEVRAELTRYLSALERRLEAVVCCHYSEVLETSTHAHPANCRKSDLRCMQTSLTGRQVVECLNKVKQKIGDVLKVGKFEAASTEQKKRRRQDEAARAQRRRGESRPNLFVTPDPELLRKEITSGEPSPLVGVVQANGVLENPRKNKRNGEIRPAPSSKQAARRLSASVGAPLAHGRVSDSLISK